MRDLADLNEKTAVELVVMSREDKLIAGLAEAL